MSHHPRPRRARARAVAALAMAAALAAGAVTTDVQAAAGQTSEESRPGRGGGGRGGGTGSGTGGAARIVIPSLDGTGNNVRRTNQGAAGRAYSRVAPAAYADGASAMADGPSPRYVSNRIFDDTGQNLFSARGVSQWAWAWGQFLDHALGLAQEGTEAADLPFDAADPLEEFTNDFGVIQFSRDAAASPTGTRQQVNTVSSYLDAWNVYGGSEARLEWLREGPVDGNLANNGPHLLLDADGNLPRRDARGDASTAPEMALMGRLTGTTDEAAVAGDVRANENIALTAIHTLFAREHNRIVDLLPSSLSAQRRFDLARRVVMAEQQYITYREFLPALGLTLPAYRGYDPSVDATVSNEFATVGYRAHSMIHGELEVGVDAADLDAAAQQSLVAQGVTVVPAGDELELTIPLNVAFGNPDLLDQVGADAMLAALGEEAQYANDEQFDNQLRSVMFQVPGPGVTDPATQCNDLSDLTQCFSGVVDLAAIDIARARDHGIPSYNDLRRAYGLPRITSFTQLTGEATDQFPTDPEIDAADPIDDPDILDIVELRDAAGNVLTPGTDEADENAVRAVRRTTLAARLRAIYGSVDEVDAFVGMVAERHQRGSEFGALQAAMWKRQFTALRDGDRFYFENDPGLRTIRERYGIDFRTSLGRLVAANTDVDPADLAANVFRVPV